MKDGNIICGAIGMITLYNSKTGEQVCVF